MEKVNILEQESNYVRYTHHKDGIHEFVFLDSSRLAVDHFFAMMMAWMEQQERAGVTPEDTVRLLTDFRAAGVPSMNDFYQRAKELRQRFPTTRRPRSITATLLQESFLVTVAQSFTHLLVIRTRDRLRVFSGDNARDEAIAWLLKDG